MEKWTFRGLKAFSICLFLSLSGLIGGYYATDRVMAVTKSRFENLELFNKILYLIETQYYREVDTDKLIEGAIRGMMQTLDPHSVFLNEELFKKMQQDTRGEFGGLGVEVSQKDGVLVIITPIDDTPAFNAGILSGDKIMEIDGESTVGITMETAVEKMRGAPGTNINLGIQREGVEGLIYFSITREIIKIQAVRSAILFDEFIYIRLSQFQQDSARMLSEHLKRHREEIEQNGLELQGIVLDVRSNPGGLLDEAVNVSSLFIEEGIIVQTRGRDEGNLELRYARRDGLKDTSTPLVVLINGASASASEIVAGAVQDHGRGLVMGSASFGKGSVQTIARVDESQGVKLTVAQYMTPDARKIQAIGIKPDIELSEYQAKWEADNRLESRYIREVDLQNHLSSTIETDDERERRKSRKQEAIKELQEEDKSERVTSRSRKPEEDYQVIQAINYLRTFKLLERVDN